MRLDLGKGIEFMVWCVTVNALYPDMSCRRPTGLQSSECDSKDFVFEVVVLPPVLSPYDKSIAPAKFCERRLSL